MKQNKATQNGLMAVPVFLGFLIALPSVSVAGEDPGKILEKATTARELDVSFSKMSLTIDNGKGQKRNRKIEVRTKMFAEGGKTVEKKLYIFTDPPDVKGTGVLAFDYADKEDDMWVYLPALRKTRRIVSSSKSKAFMGSEFSYADMSSPKIGDYNLKITKSEKIDGDDCWVIEATPKSKKIGDEEGYSKKVIWISKKSYMIRKSVFYDVKGDLLKELTTKGVVLVDKKNKRFRLKEMVMENKQNGRKSSFNLTAPVSMEAKDVNDSHFTTSYLEKQ